MGKEVRCMRNKIKLGLVVLLIGIFILSPLVAFAQEKGKVSQNRQQVNRLKLLQNQLQRKVKLP